MLANNVCGDWEPYRDKKCIKLINNKNSLQSFDEAEKSCASSENSNLISINNQDEQSFLENYLFKKKCVIENIWLGAKSDSHSHVFHWTKDGRLLSGFSNWAPGNPKTNCSSTAENCLQMHAEDELRGRWSNEPCAKKNLVVCERRQRWDLEKMQQLIEQMQENGEKLQKTNDILKEQVEKLSKNLVPLGFIYVQLPHQKSPQEIWPMASWTDDSAQYDSTFFRVAGSKSAPFGSVQEEFSPYLDEIKFDECKGAHYCTTTPYLSLWDIKLRHSGGWSPHVMSASLSRGESDWYKSFLQFHIAGGEVRPTNMAIKVWRRSA